MGSEINLDDKNQLNGIEIEPNKLNYIIALHIGYSFNLKTKKASRK
jgi:elongation factor P hydroxylase